MLHKVLPQIRGRWGGRYDAEFLIIRFYKKWNSHLFAFRLRSSAKETREALFLWPLLGFITSTVCFGVAVTVFGVYVIKVTISWLWVKGNILGRLRSSFQWAERYSEALGIRMLASYAECPGSTYAHPSTYSPIHQPTNQPTRNRQVLNSRTKTFGKKKIYQWKDPLPHLRPMAWPLHSSVFLFQPLPQAPPTPSPKVLPEVSSSDSPAEHWFMQNALPFCPFYWTVSLGSHSKSMETAIVPHL